MSTVAPAAHPFLCPPPSPHVAPARQPFPRFHAGTACTPTPRHQPGPCHSVSKPTRVTTTPVQAPRLPAWGPRTAGRKKAHHPERTWVVIAPLGGEHSVGSGPLDMPSVPSAEPEPTDSFQVKPQARCAPRLPLRIPSAHPRGFCLCGSPSSCRPVPCCRGWSTTGLVSVPAPVPPPHAHTRAHARMQHRRARTHTCAHTHVHTWMHTCRHTHAHVHTHMHTHTRTLQGGPVCP